MHIFKKWTKNLLENWCEKFSNFLYQRLVKKNESTFKKIKHTSKRNRLIFVAISTRYYNISQWNLYESKLQISKISAKIFVNFLSVYKE